MDISKIALACLAFLLLTGCGGDSGSSVSSPSSGSTGGQTQTPPLTTPTTPSTVPYLTASDFTKDRSFTAIGATETMVDAPDGNGNQYAYMAAIDGESDAIGFDYVAATRTYHARYIGDTIDATTTQKTGSFFDPTLPYDEYSTPTDGAAIGTYFARTPLKTGLNYVGYILWRLPQPQSTQIGATIRSHRMIFGVRTLAADLPQSGVSTYNAAVELSQYDGEVASIGNVRRTSAQLVIDWQTRTLSGAITLYPPSSTASIFQSPVNYPVSGIIDADGHLTGTVTGSASAGPLQGNVYGPRGGEIGLIFAYGADQSTIRHDQFIGAALGATTQ